jgi:hypothetical protein
MARNDLCSRAYLKWKCKNDSLGSSALDSNRGPPEFRCRTCDKKGKLISLWSDWSISHLDAWDTFVLKDCSSVPYLTHPSRSTSVCLTKRPSPPPPRRHIHHQASPTTPTNGAAFCRQAGTPYSVNLGFLCLYVACWVFLWPIYLRPSNICLQLIAIVRLWPVCTLYSYVICNFFFFTEQLGVVVTTGSCLVRVGEYPVGVLWFSSVFPTESQDRILK